VRRTLEQSITTMGRMAKDAKKGTVSVALGTWTAMMEHLAEAQATHNEEMEALRKELTAKIPPPEPPKPALKPWQIVKAKGT
jgi:hypothetical protein